MVRIVHTSAASGVAGLVGFGAAVGKGINDRAEAQAEEQRAREEEQARVEAMQGILDSSGASASMPPQGGAAPPADPAAPQPVGVQYRDTVNDPEFQALLLQMPADKRRAALALAQAQTERARQEAYGEEFVRASQRLAAGPLGETLGPELESMLQRVQIGMDPQTALMALQDRVEQVNAQILNQQHREAKVAEYTQTYGPMIETLPPEHSFAAKAAIANIAAGVVDLDRGTLDLQKALAKGLGAQIPGSAPAQPAPAAPETAPAEAEPGEDAALLEEVRGGLDAQRDKLDKLRFGERPEGLNEEQRGALKLEQIGELYPDEKQGWPYSNWPWDKLKKDE